MTLTSRHWLARGFTSALLIITGVWLGLCALLYVFQENYVYFPVRGLHSTPAAIGLEYEDVTLVSTDGNRIHGWWVPADTAVGSVLFLHGNAGNISNRLSTLEILHGLGLNTLIIDYQGYGNSEGRPGEQQTYDDALAAWRYLRDERALPAGNIVIFGRSLGGAIAAWLATEVNAAGLILESTFTSIAAMGREIYPYVPVTLLTRIHYPTLDYLQQTTMPTLLIHSKTDEIVPYRHTEVLYNSYDAAEMLIIEGGHNEGFMQSGSHYINGLNSFIRQVL